MRVLAELSPDHVPAPLAMDAGRGWMVLDDFGEELGWEAALGAAVPRLVAACRELTGYAAPPSLVHGDLHLANVARGPRGYLFFDWTDACVAHPFLDLPTIRRGTAFAEEGDEELRLLLRDAYLPEWRAFEPPERLRRAWRLALPLGAPHQAISYRSIVARLRPPVDLHMAQSTAWWLRQVLAWLPGRPPG
jgi:aminoglycoside phosphotransferase (APT) family kinase protein